MFIIGLLRQIRLRVEGEARRVGCYVSSVHADFVGHSRTPRLLPIDSDAVHSLRSYLDSLTVYSDAHILVLPYTPIPKDLADELQAVEGVGGLVVYPQANSQDLPALPRRPDTKFFNAVYSYIKKELNPGGEISEIPSEHFTRIAEENPRLLIARNALQTCDTVPQHRWGFLMNAADVFALLVQRSGDTEGRLDAFFRERGLEHAQTGGVSAKLEVYKNNECIHEATSHTHLKQGDHTTAAAAVRIYYQLFSYDNVVYIAILYAGPHPESDMSVRCDL